MEQPPRKPGRLRQIRVVTIRPRGAPKEPPPTLPERTPGDVADATLSAFPAKPVPFTSLDLPPGIQQALTEMGYGQATQVQAEAIPKARAGKDLIVQSRTGTGKTAAFGIPIVERVEASQSAVQALILCPTRELTVQVAEEIGRLGGPSGMRSLAIYGGDSMTRQVDGLKRGAQVVVGTPGRLLDHLRQKTLRLDAVRVLVLDEADQMLDMGFEKEVNQILEKVPKARQTLMFSATIPSSIEAIASKHQKDPERIMLSHDTLYVSDVLHLFYIVPRMTKAAALHKLIEWEDPSSSMIFCNTRAETRQVHGYLAMHGLPAAMLSSDLPQRKREQVMRRFKNKELKHLVATDVAARGIDIEDLSHVFIYSSPESSDQYIHRAGRTGRIGKTGKAISLVSGFDLMNFNRLVRANNLKAYECDLPSDEEVRQREVRRIVETLKGKAGQLTAEERAEYDPMAQGILEQDDRVAIVAYLLKARFEAEAARSVLDEAATAEETPSDAVPGEGRRRGQGGHGAQGGHGGHQASGGQGAPGGHTGTGGEAGQGASSGTSGRRRRRRRRGRGGGSDGGQGGGSHGGGSHGGRSGGDRPPRGAGDHYT
ncbi:MAG TPA: DEAD/DEAH box helicase [Candidatus Cryosericum sp.]|nr:DEAD/DEAH box helicase [Candidatus Cryosericum sp.]